MTTSIAAGWFADPTGRFAQRWYDGHRWSDHVVAANGSVIEDALPTDGPLLAPPGAQAVGSAAPQPSGTPSGGPVSQQPVPAPVPGDVVPQQPLPGQPVPGQPVHAQHYVGHAAAGQQGYVPNLQPPGSFQVAGRYAAGATLFIGLFGLILVALSLFVMEWASAGDGSTFLDLSEAVRDSDGHGEVLARTYLGSAGFLIFVATLAATVLAGVPWPSSAVSGMRVIASGVAGLGAVLHTITIARLFRGPVDPEIGAWLATIGYFVVIVALVIGHYRRRA